MVNVRLNNLFKVGIRTGRGVSGFLEDIGPAGEIRGWVYDPKDITRRVTVYFFVGEEAAGSIIADQFRQDLKAAEKGDGCCAFSLPRLTIIGLDAVRPGVSIHAYLDPNRRHELANSPRVLDADTAHAIGQRAVVAEAFDLTSPPLKAPTGFFDGVSPTGELFGWACDPAAPQKRLTIHLRLGDLVLGRCTADGYRSDLGQTYVGDGQYGFSFRRLPIKAVRDLAPGAHVYASLDADGLELLPNCPLVLKARDIERLRASAFDAARTDLSLADRSMALAALLEQLAIQPDYASAATSNDQATQALYTHALAFCRDLFSLGQYGVIAGCLTGEALAASHRAKHRTLELALYRSIVLLHVRALDAPAIEALELGAHREISCRDSSRSRGLYEAYLKSAIIHLFNGFSLSLFPTDGSDHLAGLGQRYIQLLAYILTNVYHDHLLTANFLELIRADAEAPADAPYYALSARTNQHLGRNYEAVRDFLQAKALGSASWRVYHEAGVLLSRICEGRIEFLRAKRQQVMDLLSEGLRLNHDQSAGAKVGEGFLHHFFLASVSHTMRLAQGGALTEALLERRQDLAALTSSVEALPALHSGARLVEAPAQCTPIHRSFRRVLFVASKGLWQCFYYRVQEKMDQIAALPRWDARLIEFETLAQETWKLALMDVDVVYLCRVAATYDVLKLIIYARSLGLPIVYDIDDCIFDDRHFPSPLESYAGTIDEAVHVHLAMDCPFFEQAIALSDIVTCSTTPLAMRIRERFGQERPVIVHPNLLSEELYYLLYSVRTAESERCVDSITTSGIESTREASIKIFYGSATKAHKQIFYEELCPALAVILEQYPEVKLQIIGHITPPVALTPFLERIELSEPTPTYLAYIEHVRQADINLAVLERDPFTDCKSEIKWLEAAAFGVPSVVTPTATYRDVLSSEQNVLFAANRSEWIRQLGRLIESPELRQAIGQAARTHALEAYTPQVGWRILENTLTQAQGVHHTGRNKPRLLFVNVFFAPQSVGGATRVVESHVRCLMDQYAEDYEIHILTSECEPHHWAPYSVEQYYYGSALVTKLRVPAKSWAEHRDARVYDFCLEFFRSYNFALIHFHSIQVLTASVVDAARVLNIPYLITLHDAWWLSRHMFLIDDAGEPVDPANPLSGEEQSGTDSAWLIERRKHLERCLRNATAVLAVSGKFKTLHEQALRLPGILVNENGLEPFEVLPRIPNTNTNEQGIPRVRIAHIGGMSRHKGYHLFQEAVTEGNFTNLEVLVVDSTLEVGESYRDQWGSTPVTFVAKFKQSEVNRLYARIDVLVAPSIWPESYGLVTREAASAGVWVIASDRGAIGDVVIDGVSGRIVTVSDASELGTALAEIDGNPGRFIQANESVRPRTVLEQVQECVSLYGELLSPVK